MIALSIKQPWAWLIVNGYKDVENRTWQTAYRGRILIHASKGMTHREYVECRDFALEINPSIPFPAFEKGGAVVNLTPEKDLARELRKIDACPDLSEMVMQRRLCRRSGLSVCHMAYR